MNYLFTMPSHGNLQVTDWFHTLKQFLGFCNRSIPWHSCILFFDIWEAINIHIQKWGYNTYLYVLCVTGVGDFLLSPFAVLRAFCDFWYNVIPRRGIKLRDRSFIPCLNKAHVHTAMCAKMSIPNLRPSVTCLELAMCIQALTLC